MRQSTVKALAILALVMLVRGVSAESWATSDELSVLYTFDVADAATGASALGSQPDTRPVMGRDHAVYGMTSVGGVNGNGVIYRFDLRSHTYRLLHTFSALDANGANDDGATPGVALIRGRDDDFYGVASFGGPGGTGTVFKVTSSGEFTVLHAFGAVDASLRNAGGANPLRALVLGEDGNLYGTTRLGGKYTCGPRLSGCGVAWVMTPWGDFAVIHQFTPAEGHAASLYKARDGYFYGCAVYPFATAGSGVLFRMAPSGKDFELLHRFSAVDSNGNNADGANCYEPLVETEDGVFYGTANAGGPEGSGTIFRYSLANPGVVETVHAFSAVDTIGDNRDGANPYARLTRAGDGWLYSTASYGGAFGNGVVYRVRPDGHYEVLHAFSAVAASTGANADGADPDYGVIDDGCGTLIGMADYGGNGSVAGATGNGTLYELKIRR